MKTIGGLRKLRHRGGPLVDMDLHLHGGGLQHRAAAATAGRAPREEATAVIDSVSPCLRGLPVSRMPRASGSMTVTFSATC